jgi:hypothetical protein
MKNLLRVAWLLALCLGSHGLLLGQGAVRIQSKVITAPGSNDVSARSAAERTENILAKALLKEFPDLEEYTTEDQLAFVEYNRKQALLGSEEVATENLSKVQKMLTGYHWVLNTTVTPVGKDQLSLDLACIPLTKEWGDPFSNTIRLQAMTNMDQGSADTEKLANDFVKAFAYFEPEPYQGEIKVTVDEKGHDHQETTTPVYCNGADQTYHRTEDHQVESSFVWTFQKKFRRFVSEADCSFSKLDTREFLEEDPCHDCPPPPKFRQAALVTTTKSRDEGSGQGVRNDLKPSYKDPDIPPYTIYTHVRVRFLPDATFTLFIQATSKNGKGTYHSETKAEGSCGNSHPPPVDRETTPWDGLGHTFGPFKGSPLDKQLKADTTVTLPLDSFQHGTKTVHLQLDLKRR